MKKLLILAMAALALLVVASSSFAATPGACTQSVLYSASPSMKKIRLACTGSLDDGSIPNTAISTANTEEVAGFYLYTVSAYPTAGGVAPDAADVFLLDAYGEDLLGSADGGTTPKNGANLIHATLKKTTFPYSSYLGQAYFPTMTGALTLKVINQATASATYTIDLLFVR